MQSFRKYQWIDVELNKSRQDSRKESYRPNLDTLSVVSGVLPATQNWALRARYVLAGGTNSIEELQDLQELDGTSLGVVRPKRVIRLSVEASDEVWSPEQAAALTRQRLFGPKLAPLTRIPYKFRYVFECDDVRCTSHELLIEDWELGQLYLREARRSQSHGVGMVRRKFLEEICGSERDPHFFVGTHSVFRRSWMVLGVFWPKRALGRQTALPL